MTTTPTTATHYEVAAWSGDDIHGVECACGASFCGFATPAEARDELAHHVAANTPAPAPTTTPTTEDRLTGAVRALQLAAEELDTLRGTVLAALAQVAPGWAYVPDPAPPEEEPYQPDEDPSPWRPRVDELRERVALSTEGVEFGRRRA